MASNNIIHHVGHMFSFNISGMHSNTQNWVFLTLLLRLQRQQRDLNAIPVLWYSFHWGNEGYQQHSVAWESPPIYVAGPCQSMMEREREREGEKEREREREGEGEREREREARGRRASTCTCTVYHTALHVQVHATCMCTEHVYHMTQCESDSY